MAEVVSELDKLREAAKLIEEMSQGRLQVCHKRDGDFPFYGIF